MEAGSGSELGDAVTSDDMEALAILQQDCYAQYLTVWEIDFLTSLSQCSHWTPGQQQKFDEIWQDVVVKGRGDESD